VIFSAFINCFWHGNATVPSFCISVRLHVAVNNIKVFTDATEMQKSVPVVLSSYEIFRTDVNTVNILRSSCLVPDGRFRFEANLEFLDIVFPKVPNIKFEENPSSGNCTHTRGQTDGQT
jgi:hypothetical protein